MRLEDDGVPVMAADRASWIAGGERLELGGHRLFVRQDGPEGGVPVTLLHGFPTSSHDWAPVVPALVAAGLRVTTLDLLGFGESDKPHPHAYRLVEQADLVEAAWSRLGIGSTALVAHDYGVSVAQELLARDAERITRAAWLNGGIYPELHRPLAIQRLLRGPLGPLLARLARESTFTASMRRILGRPVGAPALHEMWESARSRDGARVQPALLGYIDERREHGARWVAAIEAYAGPLLFAWGPADPVSGAHVLERLRERLPRASFVVLDAAPPVGHYPQVEDPATVAAALAGFLAPPA
jgi:pimeloyl-ACP methyl ester carboxylesterase